MMNLAQRQLSWTALILTAFYSLLASCRGEKCGPEELTRCARPLEKFTNNNELGFVTTKQELEKLCPDVETGMRCINSYTQRCMKEEQRNHFHSLYENINMVIRELCQDGPYQDEFLTHAPCMQKVQEEYELCFKKYQKTAQSIELESMTGSNSDVPVKSICCAFQEYLECSHHTVRRKCSEETAQFTKEFLDRMSSSLMSKHCKPYVNGECSADNGGATLEQLKSLLPTLLLLLVRYFT